MPLTDRHIIVGVTGSIAAYKAADLVRRLRDAGAGVRVVMTQAAMQFCTPLTFQAVSAQPVHTELLDPAAEAGMGHIELARWADLVLVAPASAGFLARLAHGMADDLLSTLCLATEAPVAVAPAMNHAMWSNAATRENVTTLQRRGVRILGPGVGDQACGEAGAGRMLEPGELVEAVCGLPGGDALRGLKVLITAGPTREPIDPVRFISNRSSGRMGFALAEATRAQGADVTLVAGPVSLPVPAGVRRIDVETAADMHRAVLAQAPDCDIFIACAAVADYRPAEVARHKIKKTATDRQLALTRTPDILGAVAALARRPFVVGFAAETSDLEDNALAKLEAKNLDMIAANAVGTPGTGFDSEYNELEVYWPGGHTRLPRTDKRALARQLTELIARRHAADRDHVVPLREAHRGNQDPG